MRSILEKAIVHLLNEENEQAEALFHKFMVEKARQIHESLRSGDEALLESFDEVGLDEMFSEDDLSGLEDDSAGDEFAGDDMGGVDDAAGDVAGDDLGGEAGLGDDLTGEEPVGDELGGDDMGDEFGDDDMGGEQATLDSIEAKLEDLQAQFDAIVGGEGGDDMGGDLDGEGDLGDDMGDEFGGEDDTFGGDVDGEPSAEESEEDAESFEDDMDSAPAEDEAVAEEFKPFKKKGEKKDDCADEEKCNEDEEFDDITESIVSELEKVMVTMSDGKEIGSGKSFSQNTKSPALQKKPNPMTDGKPVKIKAEEHKGFERETSPAVKDMKKRKNTKTKADQGQSSVSKEGDKSALINKTPGAEAQTHSPLAKR